MNSVIHPSFIHGQNFRIGEFCIIEEDVIVGDNVALGHYVMLKAGTRLGSYIDLADKTCTTGACWIGNYTVARTGAIISKANIIDDNCFIGPGVITNHTKHVSHRRPQVVPSQLVTYIKSGSIIGSQASLVAGVKIGPLAIIGAGSVVTKNLGEGVYVGSPTHYVGPIPEEYRCVDSLFISAAERLSQIAHLKKYMPYLETD